MECLHHKKEVRRLGAHWTEGRSGLGDRLLLPAAMPALTQAPPPVAPTLQQMLTLTHVFPWHLATRTPPHIQTHAPHALRS